jgi:hypothetical protein
VALDDLDRDGRLDAAVTLLGEEVAVLLGRGDGTFRPAAHYAVSGQPASLVVSDLDADGRPDLGVVSSRTDDVSIVLNQRRPAGP